MRIWIFVIVAFTVFLLFSCFPVQGKGKLEMFIEAPSEVQRGDTTRVLVDASPRWEVQVVTLVVEDTVFSTSVLPAQFQWTPSGVGEQILKVSARNYAGDEFEATKLVYVLDPTPPSFSATVTPANLEVGDNAYLEIHVNEDTKATCTLLVDYDGSTQTLSARSSETVYLNLGAMSAEGDHSVIVNVRNYSGLSYSKMVGWNVQKRDTSPPQVTISCEEFYSESQNVVVELRITDDTGLDSYSVYVDGSEVESENIEGTSWYVPINLGIMSSGAHTVVVKAKDARGKQDIAGVVVYVGRVAVPFDIQFSPSPEGLQSGDTVIINVVLQEGINIDDVKRVIFFVDGRTIAEYPTPDSTAVQLFTAWKVRAGDRRVTVYLETKDGRAGVRSRTLSIEDTNPPVIEKVIFKGVELSTENWYTVQAGYGVFTVVLYDDGALPSRNRLSVEVYEDGGSPRLYSTFELPQTSLSETRDQATYTATVHFTPGRYLIYIRNVKDVYGNTISDEDIRPYLMECTF